MSFLSDFLRPSYSEGSSWFALLKKAGGGCNDLLYSGHMLVAVLTAMAWTVYKYIYIYIFILFFLPFHFSANFVTFLSVVKSSTGGLWRFLFGVDMVACGTQRTEGNKRAPPLFSRLRCGDLRWYPSLENDWFYLV